MSFTFIDLFCGCGGFSAGLKDAGLRPVLAVDNDRDAIETYSKNVSKSVVLENVKNLKVAGLKADVLVAGLPCQGFSTLGKRNIEDERNYLWKEFLRVLKEMVPPAFMLENVPQFLNSFHFNEFKKRVEALDYKLTFDVLDASDYGMPQVRKRAIVLGSLLSKPKMPNRTVKRPKTVRDAIGDLPLEPNGINGHEKRQHKKKTLERFKHIPIGGDWKDLPKGLLNPCWKKLGGNGYGGVFGRLKWDEPSVTIRTTFLHPECGRFIHPEADRGLTIREGARLQGFPDRYQFVGSMSSRAKQIGNAVPPLLAEALGKSITFK